MTRGGSIAEVQHNGSQAQATGDHNNEKPGQQAGVFQRWAEQERQRRHTLAIEITDEAIRKFRPNTMDPERFLTASVMWYNRFMLLAPDASRAPKICGSPKKTRGSRATNVE